MKIVDALNGVNLLGLDGAPIIYFVERHPNFHPLAEPFFQAIDNGKINACTSTLTFTETLVMPLRNNNTLLLNAFQNLLSAAQGLTTIPVSITLAMQAADLRARYNLRSPDAIQLATAVDAGCDAFLTNDDALKRATGIRVLVLKD